MGEAVVAAENALTLGPLVNWARLQELMGAAGVDAIVASTPVNVTYLSDFWSISHWTRRSSQVFAIALRSSQREVLLVLPLSNADLLPARSDRAPSRVFAYGRFSLNAQADATDGLEPEELQLLRLAQADADLPDRPAAALAVALREALGARGRVALEADGLLEGDREVLEERLPGWRFTPASPLLRQARAIKTTAEIARLRAAARLSSAAFDSAISLLADGATETDVERRLLGAVVAGGGLPFLTSITSGGRTCLPNGQATGRRLAPGDLVRFDGGCRVAHYVADIARIAVIGKADAKQVRYYSAVVAGLRAAVDAARPGATGGQVFDAAVQAVRDAGIPHYQRPHCGHGIGIENYDLPAIAPGSEDVLEPGMVICLETPYYEIGWGGVQAEDTFLVTPDGLEAFTSVADVLPEVALRRITPTV